MTDSNQQPAQVPNTFLTAFEPGLKVLPTAAIEPRDAIEAALLANGNLALAGEKLAAKINGPGAAPFTEQEVILFLSKDLPATKQAIQTNLIVNLYGMIGTAFEAARRSLPHLEPKDAVHAAVQLMNQLNQLTDDKTTTQNINVNEYVFKQLDPEMRQLMVQLKALEAAETDEQPTVVDIDSADSAAEIVD